MTDLTEDEARKKVCPYLPADTERELVNDVVVYRVRNYSRCISSDCMMWRWHQNAWWGGDLDHEPDESCEFDASRGLWKGYRQSQYGYCGLAGKPIGAK